VIQACRREDEGIGHACVLLEKTKACFEKTLFCVAPTIESRPRRAQSVRSLPMKKPAAECLVFSIIE
jgi:hypothetical protein